MEVQHLPGPAQPLLLRQEGVDSVRQCGGDECHGGTGPRDPCEQSGDNYRATFPYRTDVTNGWNIQIKLKCLTATVGVISN